MGNMKNHGLVEGFLMNEIADTSKGSQPMARFHIAHHYFSHGHRQFFIPVVMYGKSAEWALEADLRKGDMLQLDFALKGLRFKDPKNEKFDRFGCELMGNRVFIVKKGKMHPEGGEEGDIGLPEGI